MANLVHPRFYPVVAASFVELLKDPSKQFARKLLRLIFAKLGNGPLLILLRKFLRWLALGPPASAKNVKVTHAYRAKLSAYNKIAESFKEFPPVEEFQARLNYVGHILHRVLQQGLRKEDKYEFLFHKI